MRGFVGLARGFGQPLAHSPRHLGVCLSLFKVQAWLSAPPLFWLKEPGISSQSSWASLLLLLPPPSPLLPTSRGGRKQQMGEMKQD